MKILHRLKRIPELDALRGGAALGIVVFHAHHHELFWAWSLVDLFFVLSGFLITRDLLRPDGSKREQLRRFWFSRIVRIWPVYYLVLSAAMLKYWLGQQIGTVQGGWPNNLLASIFFVQNYAVFWTEEGTGSVPSFDHSWSLAVEEQFYFVWPFLVFLLRSRPRLLALFCLVVVAGGITTRMYSDNHVLLASRMDGLGIGSLLACLELSAAKSMRASRWLKAVAILAFAGAIFVLGRYLAIGYSISGDRGPHRMFFEWPVLVAAFAVVYGCAVWSLVVHSGASRLVFLRGNVCSYFASISYALYMVHFPILAMLMTLHVRHSVDWNIWSTLALLASSIGAAHLVGQWVEKPLQMWKKGRLAAWTSSRSS